MRRYLKMTILIMNIWMHGTVMAQPTDEGKGHTGLSLGGQFSARTSEGGGMGLSPVLMWRPLQWWQVGGGPDYTYSSGEGGDKGDHRWGARAFMRFMPLERAPFLHLGYTHTGNGNRPGKHGPRDATWLGIGHRFGLKGGGGLELTLAKGFAFPGWEAIGGPMDWSLRAGVSTPLFLGKREKGGRKHHYRQAVEKDTTRIGDRPFSERLVMGGNLSGGLSGMGTGGPLMGNGEGTGSDTLKGAREMAIMLSPTLMYELFKGVYLGGGTNVAFRQDADGTDLDLGMKGLFRYAPDKGLPYGQLTYDGLWSRQDTTGEGRKQWQGSLLLGAGYVLGLPHGMGLDISIAKTLLGPSERAWQLGLGVQGKLGGGFQGVPSFTELSRYLMAPINKLLGKASLEGGVTVSGNDLKRVTVAPMFNFPLDSALSLGVGLSYSFGQDSLDLANRKDERYGGNLYVRFLPEERWPYLQAEYVGTYMKEEDKLTKDILEGGDQVVSAVMVGMGYKLRISKRSEVGITVLRNLTYKGSREVYPSPWTVRTTLSTKLIKGGSKYTGVPGKSPPVEEPKANFLFGGMLKVEGNMGISLGERTRVDISPLFAHELGKGWSVGLGPTYQYQEDKRQDINSSVYGGRAFARFRPLEGFPYFQTELESLKGQSMENLSRQWYTTGLLGGGVDMPMGTKASFNISALRDLTWQRGKGSLRNEPWVIRMGLRI